MTALHNVGILSTNFMRQSLGMHFNEQVLICGISFLLNTFEPISCVVTRYGGIQNIALFGKRPSPYYGKNSSNKQRETTVKSLLSDMKVNQCGTFQGTGKEEPELPQQL